MATVSRKATFRCHVFAVWNTVTDFQRCGWRSDLQKTELLGEQNFAEYAKDGTKTIFTVTASEPCRRLELDMENGKMRGHWVGIFAERGMETEAVFTETVTAKSIFLKPFVRLYLQKQQARYIADLAAAVQNAPR